MTSWWQPVGVITGLELRRRVRATGWRYSLAGLFAVISLAVFGSLYLVLANGDRFEEWSRWLYTLAICVVLFLGVIIAPTLSAASISGDRRDATLALVQATPITHCQLATGKLLGSWAASMVLPLLCLPYLIWGIIAAPAGVGWCLLGVVVVALLLGCFCALGLGCSALASRPTTSAVLAQFAVLFLVLGLPALFGLLQPLTHRDHVIPTIEIEVIPVPDGESTRTERECVDTTKSRRFTHTEQIWWLLAPNPFVIVGDAVGPHEPGHTSQYSATFLRELSEVVSQARSGPYLTGQRCNVDLAPSRSEHDDAYLGRSWQWGLAVNLALGAGGFAFAARRLRTPARKLPRGVRIA
ncbi:ABC transporter permease [Mycolicibacterium brumae]|uniref:ABC transporter permease n=1 Tax=Mycolicibacterium brumae TaxID=85968 RepID=A0A2G5PG62_9MYCO|nr:ABC transporter permease subunit [Mycolicibacterium brumae]MCV7191634.1 ABC transporter permease subunit [Mycolicibacterium brumae]PIB76934.1 ABC transporter permease [Mycolicibacterium brumae]RWA20510.1 hypothetical protein MBRU_02305 [Mycolicibacterium brumae DSM 44177]UWW07610.1 ABC transporter permease [Mycolicibacterium brumae]